MPHSQIAWFSAEESCWCHGHPVSVAEDLDVPGRPNEICPDIPSPSLQSCIIEGSSSESGYKIQVMQAISGGKQFAFVFGGNQAKECSL